MAVGRLRLSPVIRYTRWNNSAVTGVYGGPGAIFFGVPSWQSTQNQMDALLGIAWKVR